MTEREAIALFVDWLDTEHQPYTICGVEYQASEILKETDPIGFDTHLADWISEEELDVEGYS